MGYSSVLTPTGNTVSGSEMLGYYHCETATLVASHKYLIRGHYERDYSLNGVLNFYGDPDYTPSLQIRNSTTTNNGIADFDFIFEAKAGQVSPRIGMGTSVSYNSSLTNCMLFDLTKMFGNDANIAAALGITTAEITTDVGVAAFERWLQDNVGPKEYYANHGKDICFVSRYLLLYNIRNQFKS